MINRRRPRVFRLVSPFKKGSIAAATIFDAADEMSGMPAKGSQRLKEQIVYSGSETSFLPAAVLRKPLLFVDSETLFITGNFIGEFKSLTIVA